MNAEKRAGLLGALDTKTKVIGLVAIVLEATLLASIQKMPEEKVFWAVVVAVVFFVCVLSCLILLQIVENKKMEKSIVEGSPLTPSTPLLKSIITGAMHTVCRGVTVPKTPEEAQLRAFIFRKNGDSLVCSHYWAPESMIIKEQVGLTFPLDRKRADSIAVLKAYFDGEPARTNVEGLGNSDAEIRDKISKDIKFVLAVPIFSDDSRKEIIGVVDLDSSNDEGKALLSSAVSDNVMWHLAEHIRLLFSLVDQRKESNV